MIWEILQWGTSVWGTPFRGPLASSLRGLAKILLNRRPEFFLRGIEKVLLRGLLKTLLRGLPKFFLRGLARALLRRSLAGVKRLS